MPATDKVDLADEPQPAAIGGTTDITDKANVATHLADKSSENSASECEDGESEARKVNDNYMSLPDRLMHEKFLRDVCDLLIEDAVFQGTSRTNAVLAWSDPETLKKTIDFSLPLRATPHSTLLGLSKLIIKHSVKTGHPRFANQLFSSVDPYGLAGQWLTDALNPSVYTYEVSPVFTLMEEEVLREMRKLVGFEEGKGDGLFCPGGSLANGYAMNLARHHKHPTIKKEGQRARLVVFTSEDAHYSVKKLAAFLGIGQDNVVSVNVDERGRMMVDELEACVERAKQAGGLPLMVSATAGTTVMGAYDDLCAIGRVCRKHELWFHVDAAWGGGALFSRKHRSLLKGIQNADSVTWNPHKLLAAPQQCSTLLTKHENLLQTAHGSRASYLFQTDKFYDCQLDSGDKHVQCGRRADVLKFWYMWKAKGTLGLERHIDRVFELSRHFRNLIANREGFELIAEPECTNVCFWYVPPSLRSLTREARRDRLHLVAPTIKERMMRRGTMMLTYQPLRGMPNFFRLVLQNSGVDETDMRFFADEIERLGRDL